MPHTIGTNLRVTGFCTQGDRKYMEDTISVAYQKTEDLKDLEYAYFGIFDGHGGKEAAQYAKEHLMDTIVEQKNFRSNNDEDVLKAIRDGFIQTHMAMWKEVGKWPKTSSGLPSTAGTTASILFIKKGKMYVGHVGDSAIVLGYQEPGSNKFGYQRLTKDHKPSSPMEKQRIESVGGRVMAKSGVQRVVWNRPRAGHKGPVRRSTHIDQIPFLAVARSLGDLWSYSYEQEEFVVSPEPDVSVITIDVKRDRCIILGSDGLWNVMTSLEAARCVQKIEAENETRLIESFSSYSNSFEPYVCHNVSRPWLNPSKVLVEKSMARWCNLQMRADNSSVVTVMIDPPGPSKREVLRRQYMKKKLRPREEVICDNDMTTVHRYPISCKESPLHSRLPYVDDICSGDSDSLEQSTVYKNQSSILSVNKYGENKAQQKLNDVVNSRFKISANYGENIACPKQMQKSMVLSENLSVTKDCTSESGGDSLPMLPVELNKNDENVEQSKQRGMKRKRSHAPIGIKYLKTDKCEWRRSPRTCHQQQNELEGKTTPCTRSRIRNSQTIKVVS